jgi:type I restriction enzyme M protein
VPTIPDCFSTVENLNHNTVSNENKAYAHGVLIGRDKASLDYFWLRDDSFEDGANLPDSDVLTADIIEDLRAALEEFELTGANLAGAPRS